MTTSGRKIIIHSGFHKTATTTLQEYFRVNQTYLKDEVHLILKSDFGNVEHAATNFSKHRSFIDLEKFSVRLHQLLVDQASYTDKIYS